MQFRLRERCALAMLVMALAGSTPALAQQLESRVVGKVLDTSKATLPGVTVTVTSRDTGTVREVVSGNDGNFAVTNLAPGRYTIRFVLPGFKDEQRDVTIGLAQIENVSVELGVAGVEEQITVRADAPVIDIDRPRGRERFARGGRQPAGERPQLRQPDDAVARRHERRQRRLEQHPLQRQVEPAELPELRRRRRHLRVGREPGLPQRHRLAVPAADVDGVGRGVPRQLRPRAGRERPRHRRQHHRRHQERRATGSAARCSSTTATTRSMRPTSTTTSSSRCASTSSADRSAARSSATRSFFFGSYEGLRQNTGLSFTESVPSDEARRRILAGEPTASGAGQSAGAHAGGGAAARRLPDRARLPTSNPLVGLAIH